MARERESILVKEDVRNKNKQHGLENKVRQSLKCGKGTEKKRRGVWDKTQED